MVNLHVCGGIYLVFSSNIYYLLCGVLVVRLVVPVGGLGLGSLSGDCGGLGDIGGALGGPGGLGDGGLGGLDGDCGGLVGIGGALRGPGGLGNAVLESW